MTALLSRPDGSGEPSYRPCVAPSAVWEALSSPQPDPTLPDDIAEALVQAPESALLHHALGLATTLTAPPHIPLPIRAQAAADAFARALVRQPDFVLAGLNRAELLNGVHTRRDARDAYTLAARIRLVF